MQPLLRISSSSPCASILGSSDLLVVFIIAQRIPQVHGHEAGMQRGRASPPLLRSITGGRFGRGRRWRRHQCVKRTLIDDSVTESFHVDAEGQPHPTATQIDTICSSEQTIAPIEVYFATPPTFYCIYNSKRCNQGGGLYRLNQCPRYVKEWDWISFGFPDNVPGLCERLDEQVTYCLFLQSIENTGISENVAGSRWVPKHLPASNYHSLLVP
jgi:hypothetical protein